MSKEMLVNYVPGEECRIAILEDGKLQEYYHERSVVESLVGNIYKGRVTNVEPSIQAAFVEFGGERSGFLHVTDLHPRYFPGSEKQELETVGLKTSRRDRPPIQQCLKRGQEILVQVIKEGINTKGPTLTSYLSIPGRFVVMMPFMDGLGVTRKVDEEDDRKLARKLLNELAPPKGFGFIVRTAGVDQTKTELKRDVAYLVRLWKQIEAARKTTGKVGELYRESDLVIRTLRDVYSSDITRIVLDDPAAAKRSHDFLKVSNPRTKSNILLFEGKQPVFHEAGIEHQIDAIFDRTSPLPSGGSLVFDQTEALVAIDVNSGQSRKARDAESNAYNTNCEAVDEIARQLRLRDLGGVIILDLIDMVTAKHRKSVETRFRNLLKDDRARTRVGSISQFGILEMTRQRMRPSLKKSLFADCHTCAGMGHSKSPEAVVLDVVRQLAVVMGDDRVHAVELTISGDVAFQLLNNRRAQLVALEEHYHKHVTVRVGGGTPDAVSIAAVDDRGGKVDTARLLTARKNVAKIADRLVAVESEGFDDLLIDAEFEEDPLIRALADAEDAELDAELEAAGEGQGKKKRRRRRGGRRRKSADEASTDEQESHPDAEAESDLDAEASTADEGVDEALSDADASDEPTDDESAEPRKRRRKRGGRRRRKAGEDAGSPEAEADDATEADHSSDAQADSVDSDEAPKKKPSRRRKSAGKSSSKSASKSDASTTTADASDHKPAAKPAASLPADLPPGAAPKKTRKSNRSRKKKLSERVKPAKATADAPTALDSSGYSNSVVETGDA